MSDKPLLCVDYTPTRIFRGLDIPVSTITEGARDGVVRPAPRGGRGPAICPLYGYEPLVTQKLD